ncbi:MAG: UDP-N-acetylglucosamine pyrophosphorylase [Oscillospiraceae bacterium]|nr:UDP-N-acetylglucosamine pyrophosphorylase [Oscillospiraceae bacterium]MDD3833032.1 UDP-N-acetylglucosamine pyrophosphorylase [Oscillospiraceae bacterium]
MDKSEIGRENLLTSALFEPGHTMAATLLEQTTYPWEALAGIRDFIRAVGAGLDGREYHSPRPGVWIHKTAMVAASAFIGEDIIIGADTEVRHCAFIRGSALIGCGGVVGNSTELKNVILFDGVQVPHYNYVGDSILGYKSHMGAGAITSNVKSDKTPICVIAGGDKIPTALKKFGAILGDHVEVGCGSVLNPGTVICGGTSIYPLSSVRGVVPSACIYKRQGEVVNKLTDK